MSDCWHVQPLAVNGDVGGTNTRVAGLCLNSKMSTGNIIRTLRKQRKLTQTALAAEIGWERGTIAAIEAGHDVPGQELVRALAEFFATSTDHILNRQGGKTTPAAQGEDEAEMLIRFRDATPEAKQAALAVLRAMTQSRQ